MEEEFDMSTNKGRLDYAKRNYPVGTKYKSIVSGQELIVGDYDGHLNGQPENIWLVYYNGKWAELIKEEEKMETQKLSRQGLKEIHSIACSNWKAVLERYGANSPLEDYIELTQEQVNNMFKACTKEQLPIISKYLKLDDGSVDVTNFPLSGKGFCDGNFYIIRDSEWGEYKKQSFLLSQRYDWEIKTDNVGQLCLIPTKKK